MVYLPKRAKLLGRKAMSSTREIQIWEDGDRLIRQDIIEGNSFKRTCPNTPNDACAKIWLGWVAEWLEENHLADQMPLSQSKAEQP